MSKAKRRDRWRSHDLHLFDYWLKHGQYSIIMQGQNFKIKDSGLNIFTTLISD